MFTFQLTFFHIFVFNSKNKSNLIFFVDEYQEASVYKENLRAGIGPAIYNRRRLKEGPIPNTTLPLEVANIVGAVSHENNEPLAPTAEILGAAAFQVNNNDLLDEEAISTSARDNYRVTKASSSKTVPLSLSLKTAQETNIHQQSVSVNNPNPFEEVFLEEADFNEGEANNSNVKVEPELFDLNEEEAAEFDNMLNEVEYIEVANDCHEPNDKESDNDNTFNDDDVYQDAEDFQGSIEDNENQGASNNKELADGEDCVIEFHGMKDGNVPDPILFDHYEFKKEFDLFSGNLPYYPAVSMPTKLYSYKI